MLELFAELGYPSQRSIARALASLGYAKNENSASAYLSQVLNNQRRPSGNLMKGLLEIADEDPRVYDLIGGKRVFMGFFSPYSNLEKALFEEIEGLSMVLRDYSFTLETDELIAFYSEYKSFVEKYKEKN